jgi:hypothetical protein
MSEDSTTVHFTFAAPKIGVGSKKNQYPTLNNIRYWYRWYRRDIKERLMKELLSWHVTKHEKKPYRYGHIVTRIHRDTAKRIDPDAFSYMYKWLYDMFVDLGYAIDDDQFVLTLLPAKYNSEKATKETMIEVKAVFSNEKTNWEIE